MALRQCASLLRVELPPELLLGTGLDSVAGTSQALDPVGTVAPLAKDHQIEASQGVTGRLGVDQRGELRGLLSAAEQQQAHAEPMFFVRVQLGALQRGGCPMGEGLGGAQGQCGTEAAQQGFTHRISGMDPTLKMGEGSSWN